MKNKPIGILTLLSLLTILLVFSYCSSKSDLESFKALYSKYHEAMKAGDLETLKQCLTIDRHKELEASDAKMKLQMIKQMIPDPVTVKSVNISGNSASLEVTGSKDGQTMTATVDFRMEKNSWKVIKENWRINITETGTTAAKVISTFLADGNDPPKAAVILSGHQGGVSNLAYTADGQYIVSASYNDYSLRVWDAVSGDELSNAKTKNRVRSMALSPDGTVIYTADAYNYILSWPLTGGQIGSSKQLGKKTGDSLALSQDGTLIAITAYQKPVYLFKIKDWTYIDKFDGGPDKRVLTFSPTGNLLAAAGKGNTYTLWSTKKWKAQRYFIRKVDKNHNVSAIRISQDGNYMAIGHYDSSIVIFGLKKRRELHNAFVKDASTRDIAFSPDSKLLASAQNNNTIHIWDVKSGQSLAILSGHTQPVACLAFSPDGRTLASGSEDRRIILWQSTGAQAAAATPPPETPTTQPANSSADDKPQFVDVEGEPNLLGDTDEATITKVWDYKGDVKVTQNSEGNNIFQLRYNGMLMQDVPLEDQDEGKYVLLISWASSQRINEIEDQTGLPYIYGYIMSKSDEKKIHMYLKDQQTLLSVNTANEWGLVYGIYQVPADAGAIRFFMQQADGKSAQTGSAASFDEPGIFIFSTEKEARDFIQVY